MGKKNDYYDLTEILKRNCKYSVIFGERSNGKTYAVLKYAFDDFMNSGEINQVALIRRWDEDFVGRNSAKSCYDSLICNGFGENYIEKRSRGKYIGVEYYGGRFYLTSKGENEKIIRTDKCICLAFSLNSSERYKGASFPTIKTVFFDEFIAEKIYLPDEFVLFTSILSTIIRQRDDVKIFMCGNTVSRYNPYFTEMGLYKAKSMMQGVIDVYEYGESGLTVAVEFSDSPAKKKSNIYFAFENPKLKMITTGAWQLDIYPHCPYRYKPKDIYYTYFIDFDDELMQCEMVCIDDVQFTFIHRKTTPLQHNNKNIVFSAEYNPSLHYRRNIAKPLHNIDKLIYRDYICDRVYYQDNEVGDMVHNYISWCKKQ